MAETKKQYLLEVQFPDTHERGVWQYGAYFDRGGNARFYDSLEAAKAGLDRLLAKFNKEYEYGPDGKRTETFTIGGGFAADMKHDKRIDDMNRIVSWRIRVREVTPWETVDEYEEGESK